MAKRKPARSSGRKTSGRGAAASRPRKKKAARPGGARKAAAARNRSTARKGARKAAGGGRKTARKTVRRTTSRKTARKTPVRKTVARKTTARKTPARKAKTARTTSAVKKTRTRQASRAATTPAPRRAPALDRERRTVQDDLVETPPSSLDMDRSASSFRSGRRELRERYDQHTETGPAITGGDVDADWESAYSVGDEAPGGDNPTPDQDIVEDIGRAVGIRYDDNEELKGDKKVSDRDRKRWELDPASSEDYEDR